MNNTIIYKDKFIEEPDVSKIKEYIDYCKERVSDISKQLNEYDKDVEVEKMKNKIDYIKNHSLLNLTDKEVERIKAFRNKHYNSCHNGSTYWYQLESNNSKDYN